MKKLKNYHDLKQPDDTGVLTVSTAKKFDTAEKVLAGTLATACAVVTPVSVKAQKMTAAQNAFKEPVKPVVASATAAFDLHNPAEKQALCDLLAQMQPDAKQLAELSNRYHIALADMVRLNQAAKQQVAVQFTYEKN